MIFKNKAFTLIELLIVIAIIAILTVAFLPGALKAPAKARDAGRVKSINDIAAALESYSAEHNGKLPSSSSYCLKTQDADAELLVFVSYFPNDTFPTDPNPVGAGACQDNATSKFKNAYFYKKFGSNYIVGAVVEVAASANTSKIKSDLTSTNSQYKFDELKKAVLSSGGGTATTIAPASTPYYVKVGP